jgi:hypothetical protein
MFGKPPKDGEESLIYGTHPGDFGVVLVAALITLVMVGVLVLPSPFARLEKAQAQQEKAERQKAIDKAVATGEISVSIVPAKKY